MIQSRNRRNIQTSQRRAGQEGVGPARRLGWGLAVLVEHGELCAAVREAGRAELGRDREGGGEAVDGWINWLFPPLICSVRNDVVDRWMI